MKTPRRESCILVASMLVASAVLGAVAENAEANYLVSLRGPRDDGPNEIVLLDNNGNFIENFVPPGVGGLHGPTGMAYGPDGNLYVTNASNGANNIVEFNGLTGAPIGTFATGLNGPTGLRYDSLDGNFYATNFGNFGGNTVSKISTSGTVLGNFGSGHALPTSIAIDASGSIYIGEFGQGAVKKFDQAGNLLASGMVGATGGLSFNPNNNQLLVASVVPDQIYTWDGTNANPPTQSLAIDESYVGSLIGSPNPANLYVGGQVYLDATHSVVYSTGLGILLEYTDGNSTPTQFANFFNLDPLNGVSVGDAIFTNAQGPGPKLTLGDVNEDGHVNAADIQAMMTALSDVNGFESTHDLTSAQFTQIGDVNDDGSVNNLDTQALIAMVANGGVSSISTVPEPPTLDLLLIAISAGCIARRKCFAVRLAATNGPRRNQASAALLICRS